MLGQNTQYLFFFFFGKGMIDLSSGSAMHCHYLISFSHSALMVINILNHLRIPTQFHSQQFCPVYKAGPLKLTARNARTLLHSCIFNSIFHLLSDQCLFTNNAYQGFPTRWCVSTIYHCIDTPFWSETLDICGCGSKSPCNMINRDLPSNSF